jgi:hypothetical protein
MKGLYKITLWAIVPCLLILNGCKTGSTMIKCPELSASKKQHTVIWAKTHQHSSTTKQTVAESKTTTPKNNPQIPLLASADNGISIKLPSFISKKLTDSDELAMSEALGSYSANRISLEKKENGKLYVSAASVKDMLSFAKNVSSQLHPRGYYERRYADNSGVAVAAGAIGIVAFVFAFFPIIGLLSFPLGLVAIILGAVGLRSGRPRMAVLGITFGVLAILIALLFTFIYHFWVLFLL